MGVLKEKKQNKFDHDQTMSSDFDDLKELKKQYTLIKKIYFQTAPKNFQNLKLQNQLQIQ